MSGCCGGNQAQNITQEHRDLVNHNLAGLNAKTGAHATSFTVNKVATQVVAGTNYHFHLTSNDGKPYTATIHVPLPHTNSPAQVTYGAAGHTQLGHH